MIAAHQSYFQLKVSFSPCTLFYLTDYNLPAITQQLNEKTRLSPNFFNHTPVIIDLEKVSHFEINFEALKSLLLQYQLIPIGIRNGSAKQKQVAALAGLPFLQIGKGAVNSPAHSMPSAATNLQPIRKVEPEPLVQSKVVTQPVRSGMQVYAKGTDLIVTSSVSAGAEIMADGHIHVYGHLRGRALAGREGNKQARIFCRYFDAELISIAGYYLTREDRPVIPGSVRGMLQIYLENDQIKIVEI